MSVGGKGGGVCCEVCGVGCLHGHCDGHQGDTGHVL